MHGMPAAAEDAGQSEDAAKDVVTQDAGRVLAVTEDAGRRSCYPASSGMHGNATFAVVQYLAFADCTRLHGISLCMKE